MTQRPQQQCPAVSAVAAAQPLAAATAQEPRQAHQLRPVASFVPVTLRPPASAASIAAAPVRGPAVCAADVLRHGEVVPVAPASRPLCPTFAHAPVVVAASAAAAHAGPLPPPTLYSFYPEAQQGAAEKVAVLAVPEGQQKVKVARKQKGACLC
ncbi:unnamed protein product [Prorocentrum cordatum]|uniref:Uncharacterized protein n=1 Tax=Prorocentrum cordatum TaxID=2364126 RepID=A0ABN9XK81_9DINO|nr:unnamed protein product [Polarella glacialis]